MKELGVVSAWGDTLRVGNPTRSDLVAQYMAFSKKEQNKAGVLAEQAPALLHSHLAADIAPLRACLRLTEEAEERVTLAREIALFTVAFSATKRGDNSLKPSFSVHYGPLIAVVSCPTSSGVKPSGTDRTTC